MTRKEYNGWTNYETWAVALWLDNEKGSSDYWRERAREIVTNDEPRTYDFTPAERAMLKLADELKDYHEEANPVGSDATVWADLMNAALSEVNWHEIAKHYVDDALAAGGCLTSPLLPRSSWGRAERLGRSTTEGSTT